MMLVSSPVFKPSKTRKFLRSLQGQGGAFNKAQLCSAARVCKDVYTGLARRRDCSAQCIHGDFGKRCRHQCIRGMV